MAKVGRYLLDKAIDTTVYLAIGALELFLFNELYSLTSLTLGSLLLLVAILGGAAFLILYTVRKLVFRVKATNQKEELERKESKLQFEKDLPDFGDLLAQATKQILLMGVSLESIVVKHRDNIENALRAGKSLFFNVMNPDDDFGIVSGRPTKSLAEPFARTAGSTRTQTDIRTSLSILSQLKKRYPDTLRVKTHRLVPFHSIIIIDESILQVGFYLHGSDPSGRPQVVIRKQENEKMFDAFWRSFWAAWEKSDELAS